MRTHVATYITKKFVNRYYTGCLPAICKSKSAINGLFLGVFLLFWGYFDRYMWAQFHFGTLEQQLWEITWDIACSKKVRFQGWLKLAEFLLIEFLGFPSLASIISDNFQLILKILLLILLQISWIFWNPLTF